MHPPVPPAPEQRLHWRDWMASLRNVRPLLEMAMSWVSKLILDGVVARIMLKNGTLQQVPALRAGRGTCWTASICSITTWKIF